MVPSEATRQTGWATRSMKTSAGLREEFYGSNGMYIRTLNARIVTASYILGLEHPRDWQPVAESICESLVRRIEGPAIKRGRLADILQKDVDASIRWCQDGKFAGIMIWTGNTLSDEFNVDENTLFADDWEIIEEWPCSSPTL